LLGDINLERSLLELKSPIWYEWHRSDYRSHIRDRALLSYYVLNSDSIDKDYKAKILGEIEALYRDAKNTRYISTQEKGWLLRLASLYNDAKPLSDSLPISLDFKNKTLKDLSAYLEGQSSWTSAKNISDEDMYIKVSSSGVNKSLTDSFANNMTVTTEYKNLETGEKIELNKVNQGVDITVVHKIEISSKLANDMELSIEAPVPAGFELENPRLSSGRKLVSALNRLKPDFEEYRDDRYVAAWSLDRGYRSDGIKYNVFYVAYVMRAVTPGSYLVPAISIEDMYQPLNRSNTAESRVVVIAK